MATDRARWRFDIDYLAAFLARRRVVRAAFLATDATIRPRYSPVVVSTVCGRRGAVLPECTTVVGLTAW